MPKTIKFKLVNSALKCVFNNFGLVSTPLCSMRFPINEPAKGTETAWQSQEVLVQGSWWPAALIFLRDKFIQFSVRCNCSTAFSAGSRSDASLPTDADVPCKQHRFTTRIFEIEKSSCVPSLRHRLLQNLHSLLCIRNRRKEEMNTE